MELIKSTTFGLEVITQFSEQDVKAFHVYLPFLVMLKVYPCHAISCSCLISCLYLIILVVIFLIGATETHLHSSPLNLL